MAVIYTGGSASLLYGYEGATTLGIASSAITNIFGLNQKVTSLTLNTSRIDLNKLGQVETSKFAYGQQQGSVGVGFVWDSDKSDQILKALFGAPSGTGQDIYPSGSTKPFTGVEGSGSISVSPSSPLSLTTQIQVNTSGAASLTRTLKGCVVTSLSLSTSIGEVVNSTVDMAFAKEDSATVALSSGFVKQNAGANDVAGTPYTFAHGVLTMSTGGSGSATITEVQDIDITLSPNAELLWGLGSHYATNVFRKIFEISGRFRSTFKDQELIQAVIDQSRVGTETVLETSNVGLALTFTNGTKSLIIELGGVSITDHSTSGLEPAAPIYQEVSFKSKSIRIVSDHTA
tara:strand:+ start:1376 stop:2410 length:1035 start_codon:yes stop_codon:yes gene_type:complete